MKLCVNGRKGEQSLNPEFEVVGMVLSLTSPLNHPSGKHPNANFANFEGIWQGSQEHSRELSLNFEFEGAGEGFLVTARPNHPFWNHPKRLLCQFWCDLNEI